MRVLGVDIGGTGIKGAIVDTESGSLVTERYRLRTPEPSTPDAVADTLAEIAAHFDYREGPIGCGFPAVVLNGTIRTASNISKEWIGTRAEAIFGETTRCPCSVLNDADAAGLAEMRFGAGRDQSGVVLVLTLGTGIGSSLFRDGVLVPNTEFGHVQIRGMVAEKWAAANIRDREELTWKKWASRVDEYLNLMQFYLWPELIIIGGGVSKKHEKFFPYMNVDTDVVPAQLRNEAGIVGAALAAVEQGTKSRGT